MHESASVWRDLALYESGQFIRCRLRTARWYGNVCVVVDEIASVAGLCLGLPTQNQAF